MSGVMTAAGIGAAGSLYGAGKSSKAQSSAMNQQAQMQQAQLDFQKQMYNRYLGLYGPTEQKLADEANSSQPLDYEKNYAAIKGSYGDALRNTSSSMAMRGIAGSGLDVGAMRGAALGQAGALSGAYAQGLINRRSLGLSLTGRNQIMQAGSGVGGAYQGLSNMYGNWANMYGNAAQQGWQGFGQGLGNLAYGMSQYYNQPKPVANVNTYYPQDNIQPLPSSSENIDPSLLSGPSGY